jgi:hypothetical protein
MMFMIFAVFMVCLIGISLVMGLAGVAFDAVRRSSAVPSRAVSDAELSLIGGEALVPMVRQPVAKSPYAEHSYYPCR